MTEEINKAKESNNLPVLILIKRRRLITDSPHQEFNEQFAKWLEKDEEGNSDVKLLTIHASKGLEGRTIFILGDIAPPQEHPIKNVCYELADIPGLNGQSFQSAQEEEAIRLCYVAITRAKVRCFWFFDAKYSSSVSNYHAEWGDKSDAKLRAS
jgi:ATP-dependent exoDNAse (exonuclease V) beta subunit